MNRICWPLFVVARCSSANISLDSGVLDASAFDAGITDASGDARSDAGADATASPDAAADVTTASDAGCFQIDPETTVGTPSWKLGELHVFAAPLGTPNDTNTTLNQSFSAVLGPSHVFDSTMNLFKSAYAHAGPYAQEVATGLADAGFPADGCFALSDLTAPRGIFISMNIVPSNTASMGTSFEEPNVAPIIDGYDMTVDADLFINGVLVDPDFDSLYPKVNFVYGYPNPSLDGWGHKILNWAESQAFSKNPLTAGDYSLVIRVTMNSAKTTDTVRFRVK
jgi:hypothetical protein